MNPGNGQAMVSAAPAEFVVPAHEHPLVVSFTAWMAGTAAGCLEMIKDAALAPDLGLQLGGLTYYLGPRCEHMNPMNPCHCETPLGPALDRKFITWPDRDDLNGDEPLGRARAAHVGKGVSISRPSLAGNPSEVPPGAFLR